MTATLTRRGPAPERRPSDDHIPDPSRTGLLRQRTARYLSNASTHELAAWFALDSDDPDVPVGTVPHVGSFWCPLHQHGWRAKFESGPAACVVSELVWSCCRCGRHTVYELADLVKVDAETVERIAAWLEGAT